MISSVHLLGICLSFLALPSLVSATAQQPDILQIGDLEYDLYTNPLEELFQNESGLKRPDFWPYRLTRSSGIERGYVATWEIADSKLYLISIDSWLCDPSCLPEDICRKRTLADLFGPDSSDDRVLARWYTGKLRLPLGEQLLYVHNGYYSIYEIDRFYHVKAGIVGNVEVIVNSEKNLPLDQGFVQKNVFLSPRKIKLSKSSN